MSDYDEKIRRQDDELEREQHEQDRLDRLDGHEPAPGSPPAPAPDPDRYRQWWLDAEEKLAARPASLVREFHERFDLVIREEPDASAVAQAEIDLRQSLHSEELRELHRAMVANDLVEVADALADLVYVLYGTALHYGIDLDAVAREVHRSNMTKLGPTGEPIRRYDGKVLKPDTFEPPRIAGILGVAA